MVEIMDPIDWAIISTESMTVMGNILSPEVKRVTVNDTEATVSPVNSSFVLQWLPAEWDTMNLVYKAYDGQNTLLERWVVTVYGTKGAKAKNPVPKLEPTNSPVSSKDFGLVFPWENPYKTTDTLVKVQWVVPTGKVASITVNGYRLQKYIPYSTTWYYFANSKAGSMKEGINSYSINFYDKAGAALYTQIFTVVKEGGTVSGE
jgi:hypothetical protein